MVSYSFLPFEYTEKVQTGLLDCFKSIVKNHKIFETITVLKEHSLNKILLSIIFRDQAGNRKIRHQRVITLVENYRLSPDTVHQIQFIKITLSNKYLSVLHVTQSQLGEILDLR